MIVHLGGEISIDKSEIIAILNIDEINIQNEFLKKIGKKQIKYVTKNPKECNKSMIVAQIPSSGKTTTVVYMSPISTATLYKRSNIF